MSTTYRSGPGHLLVGDPTVANGMKHCGPTESITFDAGVAMTGVQTAFTGDAYDADGVYSLPPNPQLSVELYDNTLENLARFFTASTLKALPEPDGAKAIGLGGEIKRIASLPTVVVVPGTEIALGVGAPGAIWLPAALINGVSGFQHGRLTANSNAAAPFTVTFSAARRKKDQSDAAIPADAQFGFIGQPAAYGLDWELPAIEQA